jgi:hypothetical protein
MIWRRGCGIIRALYLKLLGGTEEEHEEIQPRMAKTFHNSVYTAKGILSVYSENHTKCILVAHSL